MATTTNYGWTTPDDTALVKDGAAAIRSLGSAIDTSLNTALSTKKAGLILLSSTTFTSVASQPFTSVLSSSYKFFKITFSIGGSTTLTTTFRLRASTTDYTGGNYRAGGHVITDGASQSLYGSTTGTSWEMSANAGDANSSFGEITLIRPNEAGVRTGYVQTGFEVTGSAQRLRFVSGYLNETSAYDGFNLIASTGNITGVVNVYGYNQ